MPTVRLTVNGQQVEREVEPRRLLVDFLRLDLGLTGTHVGCDTSQCGACTVLLDGQAIKACAMLAVQAHGATVKTIEGLAATDGTLHPLQQAFIDEQATQCGYCTGGMIMQAKALLESNRSPSEEEIRRALAGNLCRCGSQLRVLRAVRRAARAMA